MSPVVVRLQHRGCDRWRGPWTLASELSLIATIVDLLEQDLELSDLATERLAVAMLRIRVAAEASR